MRTKHLIPNHAAGLTYANAYAAAPRESHGDGGGAVDPFEAFPDAVLGLIVSKLPFRSAVAASAISRRWRGAVAAAPELDLDFAAAFPAAPRRRTAFAAAATAALAGSRQRPLRRLRLALDGFFDQVFAASAASHVASWLDAAAARGVEQLELHLPRSRLAVLPPSLLACTDLTSLTLRLDHNALPLPSLCPLTHLSRLHLASISLVGCGDFFEDLCSHCTQLSCLSLEQCHIGALRLAGTPRLRSLDIASCSWTQQSSVAIAEMPALRTLRYSGAMANRHMINDADSLDEVVLTIEPQVKLLEPNLRELLVLVGNESNHLDVNNLKQFAHPEEWSKVRLDKPSQSKRRRCSDTGVQYGVIGSRRMIVRNLREIRMEYIDESKSGLDLVKLLLKNAQMLEMMTIVPSMDGLDQAKFRRRVLKFRKASRNVNIQFSATT
ncbi:F-box/LRR-repeat protein [Hordeum vulgare]|nr:F-box/LRR-repeat protein [Hordeum vulgare]